MRNLAGRRDVASTAFLFVLALTFANAAFNVVASLLGWSYPFTTFLYQPNDNFADFFEMLGSYPGGALAHVRHGPGLHAILPVHPIDHRNVNTGGLTPVTNLHMPPFSTIVCILAVQVLQLIDGVALFLVLVAGLFAYWCRIVQGFARSRGEAAIWIALGAVTYPTLMAVTRGNLYAWGTALLLIHALVLGLKRKAPVSAALLLAVAVNIRPNAIIFAGPMLLFYWQTRWRFAITLTIAGWLILGVSLLAAMAAYPGYTIASFLGGLAAYYRLYVIGFWGLAYGSSLFGALKILIGYRAGLDGAAMLVALALAGAAMLMRAVGRIADVPLLFVVAAAYILGSNVIADYHLGIFLIVPIAIALQGEPGRQDRIMIAVSCLILAPKNYLFIDPLWLAASLQVVLNPLILLVAAIAILAAREQAAPIVRFRAAHAA